VEESIGIIMVGKAVGLVLVVSSGSGSNVGIELAEDEVEGESSKDSAKGAALGEAFELLEERPERVRHKEPTGVGFIVEKVEEGYEA
jgi:hypothetical protein